MKMLIALLFIAAHALAQSMNGIANQTVVGNSAFITGGGAADVMTGCPSPAITAQALTTGLIIHVRPNAGNATTTPTFNLCSLGAVTIVKSTGGSLGALAAADYATGVDATFYYTGSFWQLINPQTASTLPCPSCVTASSPGAGIAHFAGSTQTVTSSSVANSDLANPSTTVNGTTCTLGSTCTVTASGGIPFITATGSVNAMVATFSPAITSYTVGLIVEVLTNLTNTSTAVTLNVNGLGAKGIRKQWGSNVISVGDINTTVPSIYIYDGTVFQLLNPQAQLLLPVGSASVPSYSFWGNPDYGMYNDGAGNICFSRSSFSIMCISIAGITVQGSITAASGGSVIGSHVFDSSLTSGNCVQAGASNLQTVAIPCYIPPTATTATATPGSGVTSVTCATAACTNQRGTFTVVGGTATTGTIFTLAWTATSTANVCSVTQNDTGVATAYLGLGHTVATTTGMTVQAGISVIGTTFAVDYTCQP